MADETDLKAPPKDEVQVRLGPDPGQTKVELDLDDAPFLQVPEDDLPAEQEDNAPAPPEEDESAARNRKKKKKLLIMAGAGAALLLVCDLISKSLALPINTVTALMGIPVVIVVVVRNRNLF